MSKLQNYEMQGHMIFRKGKNVGMVCPDGAPVFPDMWDAIQWEIDVQTDFAAVEADAVAYLVAGR